MRRCVLEFYVCVCVCACVSERIQNYKEPYACVQKHFAVHAPTQNFPTQAVASSHWTLYTYIHNLQSAFLRLFCTGIKIDILTSEKIYNRVYVYICYINLHSVVKNIHVEVSVKIKKARGIMGYT